LGPSEYALDDGETLTSAFASASLEAPANIEQVTVAVIADQLLAPGDLQIRVSRDGGTNWEVVSDNFSNHVFGAVPAGNNLQIEVTNVVGGISPIVIRGYGMYYNNIGGATGVLETKTGLIEDSAGLTFFNTNLAAYRASSANFGFTWNALTNILTWGPSSGGTGDDLQLEITDETGSFVHTLTIADGVLGLSGITAGSYVYFDADRSTAALTPGVDLLVSAGGPPTPQKDRYVLGRRIPDPNGGNDVFILFGNHLLDEVNDVPAATNVQYPPRLLVQAGGGGGSGGFTSLFGTFGGDGSLPDPNLLVSGTINPSGTSSQYANLTLGPGVILDINTTEANRWVGIGVAGRLTLGAGAALSVAGRGFAGGIAPNVPGGGTTLVNYAPGGGVVPAPGVGTSSSLSEGVSTGGGGGAGAGDSFGSGPSQQGSGAAGGSSVSRSGGAAGAGSFYPGGSVVPSGTGASGTGGLNFDSSFHPQYWSSFLTLTGAPGGGSGGVGVNGSDTVSALDAIFAKAGNGGAGGGLLWIECDELDIQAAGFSFIASGAAGSPGTLAAANNIAAGGGGGGGGGGLIVLAYRTLIGLAPGPGSFNVAGGGGGAGAGPNIPYAQFGGSGGPGGAGTFVFFQV
jgi:hypothetical protein